MFNAQHYMHMNNAYFAPSMIWIPYEMMKIFDWILHKLQYLGRRAFTPFYIGFRPVG